MFRLSHRVGARSPFSLSHYLALALCGCSQVAPRDWQSPAGDARSSVVIFFVDGLDYERMQDFAAAGLLPNITRRFIEGGVAVEHAVAALPPITYPNSVSLITGVFPGRHDVTGNRWFDRDELLLRDYGSLLSYTQSNNDFQQPTLFEMLSDRFTVSVRAHTFRGSSASVNFPITAGLNWLVRDFAHVDRKVGESVEQVGRLAAQRSEWPAVYYNYFPGVDETGHVFGPDSKEYQEAIIVADRAIGRIIDWIAEHGPADGCRYVLVTDHSILPVHPERVSDPVDWLERERGLRIFRGASLLGLQGLREVQLAGFDAVAILGADRRIALHLRDERGWSASPALEHVREFVSAAAANGVDLLQLDGVGLVCFRTGPNSVEVHSRNGAAIVERRLIQSQRFYRYRPHTSADSNPADPLGYLTDQVLRDFVQSGWRESRQWLVATAGVEHPDFVPQIVEMFDSPRTGDVVIFAEGDWSFSDRYRGGHGSSVEADMRIPMYFAGPGLPAGGSIACGRLVDLVPTVLDMLGETDRIPPDLDGMSLWPQLQASERTKR